MMNKRLGKYISEKLIACIIITIFLISLVPLFYIAPYIHPGIDDYVYGAEAYHIWNNSHSLSETLQTAIQVSARMYNTWQGSYSACFLMALQPDVFGCYQITPFIMIIPFIFTNYWLTYLLIYKYLKANKWQYLIITTTIVLMGMQYLPSLADAFYWYNGAIYYTFYYTAFLLLACLIIQSIYSQSKFQRILYNILACVTCIFVAGGNYVTGLVIPVLLLSVILTFTISKRKIPVILYLAFAIFMAAFFINIIAPGNAERAKYVDSIPALEAIAISFTNGCHYIAQFTTPTTTALFIFILPILYRLTKKIKFKYPHPILVALGSYCIYCTLFTPTCYALGSPGNGRNFNLYFYCYIWLIVGNMFYISGAIRQKAQAGSLICKDLTSLASHLKDTYITNRTFLYAITIFLFGITILQSASSSKKTLKDLTSGKAISYHKAMKARLAEYKSNKQDIIVPSLEKIPSTIFTSDITFDKGHWINQGISLYYGKHSIMTNDINLTEREKEEQQVRFRKEVGPGEILYKKEK